jgi:uncharacterized membrane protein YjjP (DUF1212 family)
MSKLKEFFEPKETEQQPKPEKTESDEEFKQTCRFVAQMVVQAHRYGASYVRLEEFFTQLPRLFGVHGEMLAAAPFAFFEFRQSANAEPYRLTYRLSETSFELTKLSDLWALVTDLEAGNISVDQGAARLKEIDSLPAPYKNSIVALAYSLCGAGFAVLLSAVWFDVILAALLSLVVFGITWYAGRSQWLSNRINFTAAFVASILANLMALLFSGSNPFTVALCAVIVLIPGLALTLGAAELASKSIISGISRLVDGVSITLVLVIGTAFGSSIVNTLWPVPAPADQQDYSLGLVFLFIVLLMLGLSFIFQVRRQDLVWVVLAGVIAYAGVLLGGQFGDWQGSFIGALGLGLYTGLVSLRRQIPGSVVMLPGIMILVPGVAAYFGVNTMQTNSIFSALPAVWGVMVQIVAIMGGMYVAASIMPRKTATL